MQVQAPIPAHRISIALPVLTSLLATASVGHTGQDPVPPARPEEGAEAPDLLGPWTGWLYMDDGDVPVRARLEANDEGLSAFVDLPAAGPGGNRVHG